MFQYHSLPEVQPSTVAIAVLLGGLALSRINSYSILESPKKRIIHPSLEKVLRESKDDNAKKLEELYPADVYDGGAYVDFPMGRVRYWLLGPENGVKVVLINGIMTPTVVWADVVPKLLNTGRFRILLYDHYGRGYSEAPETEYDVELYITQLSWLLQYLKWEKCKVVGLSMGGGVAAAFAAAFPWLVDGKVAFLCPAGVLSDDDLPLPTRLLTTRLGVHLTSLSIVKAYIKKIRYRPGTPTGLMERAEQVSGLQQTVLPHFMHAVASSLRVGPIRGQLPCFETIGRNDDLNVLFIWGTNDQVVPYRHSVNLLKCIPKSRIVAVEGAGHEISLSHPDLVANALVEFFDFKPLF
ncbi:hypothetical protein FRC03_007792 [Tulasnella sp. 419]|nr:hypothetical protein FRC03_007792 [Tulasnella sp. 419]